MKIKKCKHCGTTDNLKTDKLGKIYNYCNDCLKKEKLFDLIDNYRGDYYNHNSIIKILNRKNF